MSPGISIELHWYRGFGPTIQHDLFFYGFRLGFVTVSICKECVIDRYAKLRETVVQAIDKTEGR